MAFGGRQRTTRIPIDESSSPPSPTVKHLLSMDFCPQPASFEEGCIAAELYDSTMITAAIPVRLATAADVDDLAALLHDFNTEFETPTPGAEVLAPRLRSLLGGSSTFAMLCGASPIGFGLVTLRWKVWFVGLVGIIDEFTSSRRHVGAGSALR